VVAIDSLLSGDLQNAFGFVKPTFTGISPAMQPTSGKSEITFFGVNFGGNPHDLARLQIGSTPCHSTTWLSDTSARCRIPSGVANQLSAAYSIGSYVTVLTRVFTYISPVVGSIRPSYGNTRGGNTLSITGNSFGHGAIRSLTSNTSPPFVQALIFFLYSGFYQQSVQVGASMCQRIQYTSDSSLRCVLLPGPGDFLDVVVSVSGQRGVLANSCVLAALHTEQQLRSSHRAAASLFPQSSSFCDARCRYSYYSADDNSLNESPLSLSQEKYNQLLGFTITSAIMSFALAIGCAKIYTRARNRYSLVVPTESDHPSRAAPSFWMWLWHDLTRKEIAAADETFAAAPKPVQPTQTEQKFRRTAKKGYVQRADVSIDSLPPTPQAVAAALGSSEYFRALAQEEQARRDALAQMARDENEELGLRIPSNLLRAPQQLPPSHGRRQRGVRGTPPPALPKPY
jgi:hypothetical protein